MSAGTIVVHGDVGPRPGCGMKGGRLIINGRCPTVPDGVEMTTLSAAEFKKLNALIEDSTLKIPKDAVCLVAAKDSGLETISPSQVSSEGWSAIGLVNGGEEATPDHAERDTMVVLGEKNGEAEAIGLPLPLLPIIESGKNLKGRISSVQPFIVSTHPRAIDMVLLDEKSLCDASSLLKKAGGFVLDLSSLPTHDPVQIDGLLVALRALVGEHAPVILMDDVDRVERLHRLGSASIVDAVIANLGGPSGCSAYSALPLIGRSSAAAGLTSTGAISGIGIDWIAEAKDLAISCAAGCLITTCRVGDESPLKVEEWLAELNAGLNGWLVNLGLSSIDQLSRRHLRALDHDCASTSGLRLSGYGRPLPHWFAG